ncbi:unnamed protein product [Heligmosomoides polygyrus]|uniref:Tyrosinase_Cu-bd domain-containing protein n=1 Tax=Heligmosomoides polygyrus TaxID=6339 RepID=A0A183F1S1_HELPZ|nr:unnamed protein product [Heligmosomoides polygyrus]
MRGRTRSYGYLTDERDAFIRTPTRPRHLHPSYLSQYSFGHESGDASVSGNLFLDYSRGSDPSLFAYSHLAFAGHVILIRMFLRLSDVEVVNIDVD